MDDLKQREQRPSWVNPYKLRLNQFPNRIFTFEDFEADCLRIKKMCTSDSSCLLELGSGSGAHLIELAAQNPEKLVFGFEIRFKRAVRTIEKANVRGISNCFVLRVSYDNLQTIFPNNSVSRLYVNFPDPWAKKSQRKHRILSKTFLDLLPDILKADGDVYIKTDHREYFDTFHQLLSSDDRYSVLAETWDLYSSEYLAQSIPTEFERLFTNKGEPIHHLLFTQK